jgi:hypothetical protein
MALNGYFVKVGTTTFPNYIIARGGYKCTPNQRTDKNSYIDGKGGLNRSILPVKRTTVKIQTIEGLRYSEKLIIQSLFPSRDVVTMEYWNDEDNAYKTAKFYVPDIEFVTDYVDKGGKQVYQALEIIFVAYEGDL